MTQEPLDPRKSPWKRGDVFTSGFKKSGFVVDVTTDYLELLWMPGSTVERTPLEQSDDLIRVAHAESLSADGAKTNLEVLETIEALDRIARATEERVKSCKTEREKQEVNALIQRSFAKDGCAWDRAHSADLFTLAVKPQESSVVFRLQERVHRMFCKQH